MPQMPPPSCCPACWIDPRAMCGVLWCMQARNFLRKKVRFAIHHEGFSSGSFRVSSVSLGRRPKWARFTPRKAF